MKITKAQLKELIRPLIKERLSKKLVLEQDLQPLSTDEDIVIAPTQLPIELQTKSKEVAEKYMRSDARWFSLENLFWELEPWFQDPMEAVTYLYNEINKASRGEFDTAPSRNQREKARTVYNRLINLAQQARLFTDNEEIK